MDFKFFKKNDYKFITLNQGIGIRPQISYDNAEFCFQFGDGDPVVFATGLNESGITITLNNTSEGNITFTDNDGNTFKLFARERQ